MDDRMQDIGDAKPRMSKRRRFIVVGRWALKLKGWSGTMSDTAPSAMPSMHVIRTAAAQAVSSPICCHSAFASRKPSTANSTKYATAEGALTAGPKYTTAAHAAASDWLVGAGGALAGGIVAHPALRLIDSFVSSDL